MRVEPATSGPRRSDGTPDAAARPAIQIPLDQGRWPGLTLEEPVRDWRGWRALVVELANPTDAPLHIVVRVNDQALDNEYYDRFNRGFDVPAGSQRRVEIPIIEIEQAPKNRRMDLTAIAKIVIFHEGPAPGRAFLVERVSLVR